MTHLPMRLQPPHARSRRCQRAGTAGGRTGALRRLGPHAPSTGWTPFVTRQGRRCLHEPPPERRRPAQEATPCAGQRASCRCALRAGRSPSHRVASCAALRQRRNSRPLARSAFPVQVARLGSRRRLDRASTCPAPSALRWPRWGVAHLRVSPGAGRCCPLSCGSGSNPSPRPSQGRERVALCRQRCMPLRPHAPPSASVERHVTASRPSPSGGLRPAWTRC